MALFRSIQAVPNSLTGGNVVGLLLRQAILRLKLPTSKNPKIYIFERVPVTARTQEVHTYTTDVTSHAIEDGSIFTDHAILQPVEIDLVFEISNLDPDMVWYSFNLLVQIRDERVPFDLLTQHKVIKRVIITSLKLVNQSPMWGKIEVQCSFKQLSVVQLVTVNFPTEKVTYPAIVEGQTRPSDPDVSKSIESATDTGLKKIKDVTGKAKSTLFKIFSN